MIASLRGVLAARWLPYVVVGAVAWTGAVSLWSYGKGFAKAEVKYLTAMQQALEAQNAHLKEQSRLAVEKERRKHDVHKRVQTVRRIQCDLPPECVQWTEDIMRAAHPDN